MDQGHSRNRRAPDGRNHIPANHVIIDAIGVGQGLHDLLRGSVGYKSNHIRLNDEGYQSQSDQLYYKAQELLSRGQLRVKCPEVQQTLTEELMAHKRYNQGKDQLARVTPSDQVSRSLGRSPDHSSAFVMRLYFLYVNRDFRVEIIKF